MPRVRAAFAATLVVLSSLAGLLSPALAAEPARLEFNRDIRPILSENCFQCHGQDPARREAKLRLDERENAIRDRDGRAVIVPGNPDASELIARIISTDDDEVMPPKDSNKHLSAADKERLRQWIAQGAPYQKHWAFEAPRRPDLPAVSAQAWSRQPLDRFVLARLDREKLKPAPETAPATWLRRASLDLVGLPPTPAELDRFVADVAKRGETAYSAAVDRLLASPHFGERLAMDWMDAARYADTHGFNNDSARSMWRWRDWVIDAFNTNKPYNTFITEQLAGDLLPKPTLDQRLATGFNRNHVINSEGGIIDEEYRVEYVADRVRTTSTAWLGLTMECARCHDHKFDPIAQRDYYRLFAFFNNVPEIGEDGRVANAVPLMPAPTREQQATLAKQERELATLDAKLAPARTAWQWRIEDKSRVEALAATAKTTAEAEKDGVVLDLTTPAKPAADPKKGSTPAPAASAPPATNPAASAPATTVATAPPPPVTAPAAAGETDPVTASAFTSPSAKPTVKLPSTKLDFAGKEGLSLALWLRPSADNPRDVALLSNINYAGSIAGVGYGSGSELRLIDGELELIISNRLPAYAAIVRSEGAKLRPGEWRHIAVTYAGNRKAADIRFFVDGVELGTVVRHDGAINNPPRREFTVGTDGSKDAPRWSGDFEGARSFPRVLSAAALRALFQVGAFPRALAAVERDSAKATVELGWLRDALLADDAKTQEASAQYAQLFDTHLALKRSLPSVMVMQELPQPRQAYVLNRGQYDAHGDKVEPGVPEALLAPWPTGAPKNRLGLAQWFTQPNHPLTARVVVNRFWAQLFGTGLVKTLEDFGSQSEWPSHPELLDWLARDFVDGGWNVKAFFKSVVLSATYRQNSAVSAELQARDPENRLLARGPRGRLPGELVRDQALALSGLLTPRIGGPSVYPYQPDKLYEGLVVGAAYPGTTWPVSSDADFYRRSLYTFWKRTVPHPVMTSFDVPDREFCTVRRARTNTPLQALALLNEPGYVEAARQFATRMLRDAPGDDTARVGYAFRAATGRAAKPDELRVLTAAWEKLRADFAAHPEEAEALLGVGRAAVDATVPPAELAAATGVASMILNLDETISKN